MAGASVRPYPADPEAAKDIATAFVILRSLVAYARYARRATRAVLRAYAIVAGV
jgi:hypothetical protein